MVEQTNAASATLAHEARSLRELVDDFALATTSSFKFSPESSARKAA